MDDSLVANPAIWQYGTPELSAQLTPVVAMLLFTRMIVGVDGEPFIAWAPPDPANEDAFTSGAWTWHRAMLNPIWVPQSAFVVEAQLCCRVMHSGEPQLDPTDVVPVAVSGSLLGIHYFLATIEQRAGLLAMPGKCPV